jgi:hypothetical protein
MKHDSVTRRSFIQGSLASATAVSIGVGPSGLLPVTFTGGGRLKQWSGKAVRL